MVVVYPPCPPCPAAAPSTLPGGWPPALPPRRRDCNASPAPARGGGPGTPAPGALAARLLRLLAGCAPPLPVAMFFGS